MSSPVTPEELRRLADEGPLHLRLIGRAMLSSSPRLNDWLGRVSAADGRRDGARIRHVRARPL